MTIENKTEKESPMEQSPPFENITDVKLARVYLLIKKHGTVTRNDLEETLEMSPRSLSHGLKELREMGCITFKRKTISHHQYVAVYSITAHNCDYCTPHIKYERIDHSSIFLPPVGDF